MIILMPMPSFENSPALKPFEESSVHDSAIVEYAKYNIPVMLQLISNHLPKQPEYSHPLPQIGFSPDDVFIHAMNSYGIPIRTVGIARIDNTISLAEIDSCDNPVQVPIDVTDAEILDYLDILRDWLSVLSQPSSARKPDERHTNEITFAYTCRRLGDQQRNKNT